MKNSKKFKRLTILALGVALVAGSRVATVENVNATTDTATPVESIVQQLNRRGSIAVGWTEEGTMAIFLEG